MSYVTVRTDARVYGECRAEAFLEDFLTILFRDVCRKRYAEERDNPEYADLGGES